MKNYDFRNDYEIKKELREGGYGKVYEACLKNQEDEKRAIKVISKDKLKRIISSGKLKAPSDDEIKHYIESFKSEVDNMKLIEGLNRENKNTVKYYESFLTKDELAIVMELCDINLLDYIIDINRPFSEEEIYDLLSQLNYTFRIMKEALLVHRDLKLENILIKYENETKDKYTYKLTEYGASKKLLSLTKKLQTSIGTCNYMAPEVLENLKYNQECDLWSLGVIIYNLCFQEYPYNVEDENCNNIEAATLKLIKEKGQTLLKQCNSPDLDNLIKGLLIIQPDKRLTWKQYFNHDFFIKKDFRNYYDLTKLAEGGYGVVYRAKHKKNNQERAIKVIDKNKINAVIKLKTLKAPNDDETRKYLYKEIEYMETMEGPKMDNQNTVKYYEYFNTPNEFAIVLELCKCNLQDLLEEKSQKHFNWKEIYKILNQLNNSFRLMVKNKIAHRDLKLTNILVKYNEEKAEPTYKLTDYGVSKQKIDSLIKKFTTKQVGTDEYMAPEIMFDKPYDERCDLWSLGIIIYKLCFNEHPIGKNDLAIFNILSTMDKFSLKQTGNEDLDDLIDNLLKKDPEKRLNWDQYFQHRFFTEEPNKITIIVKVEDKDKTNNEFNNIYFLDNEPKMKTSEIGDYKENEEIKKLIEANKNVILYINGKEQDKFNKFFKPDRTGQHKIVIKFQQKITDCSFMFGWCDHIKSIDLSYFDSSNVTTMHHMFTRCHYLEKINLDYLNIGKVKDLSYMFNKCFSLTELKMPKDFKTDNVENMEFMYHYCQSLKILELPSSFKTNNVTNMKGMFKRCHLLENLNLQFFNTEKVKDMSYMFSICNNLKKIIINPNTFKTQETISMGHMFNRCNDLSEINVSSFTDDKIEELCYMFGECQKLKNVNLSNFGKKGHMNKKINMVKMFSECTDLETIDLSSLNVTKDDELGDMFKGLRNIKEIKVGKNCINIYKTYFDDENIKKAFVN